jgi:hypothetical protein
MPISPPYEFIYNRLRENRVIPFLGSGASLGSRKPDSEEWRKGKKFPPTAGELAHYLAQVAGFPVGEPPDLAKVAQFCDIAIGRRALYEELREIFNNDYPLTLLHTYLASSFDPLLIVTTNYDNLVERALEQKKRKYDLVIHTTGSTQLLWRPHDTKVVRSVNSNELDINLAKTTVVYKMHGAVDRHQSDRDNFVISEDDYIEFLARMTNNTAIPSVLAEPFKTRHFLFLGHGLYDWNLRVVLNRIDKDIRRPKGIKSWAIQYNPKPLEQRFWEERDVNVYDMLIKDFVSKLKSKGKEIELRKSTKQRH